MDFRLEHDKERLESTAYIEVGPGPYSGKHWQPGYTFISEDAFVFVEGIIGKHFHDYDHFSMNDIPSRIVFQIAEDLKNASDKLAEANDAETNLEAILLLGNPFRTIYQTEISQNTNSIIQFVRSVSELLLLESRKSEVVCIMGI